MSWDEVKKVLEGKVIKEARFHYIEELGDFSFFILTEEGIGVEFIESREGFRIARDGKPSWDD